MAKSRRAQKEHDELWGFANRERNMAAARAYTSPRKAHDPSEFAMVAPAGRAGAWSKSRASCKIPRVLTTIAAGAGSCLGLLAHRRESIAAVESQIVKDIDWRGCRGFDVAGQCGEGARVRVE